MIINKQRGTIWWREYEVHQILKEWQSFSPIQFKISVEEALRISEENGGHNVRQTINNKCDIHISFAPDGLWSGWAIDYFSFYNQTTALEVNVNQNTGAFQVRYPEK
jgi:hypothetical protein